MQRNARIRPLSKYHARHTPDPGGRWKERHISLFSWSVWSTRGDEHWLSHRTDVLLQTETGSGGERRVHPTLRVGCSSPQGPSGLPTVKQKFAREARRPMPLYEATRHGQTVSPSWKDTSPLLKPSCSTLNTKGQVSG